MPPGLCGLRTQIEEAEEGPLELRREKSNGNAPGGKEEPMGGERRQRAPERESEHLSRVILTAKTNHPYISLYQVLKSFFYLGCEKIF